MTGETDEYEPQTSGETTKDQHSSDQQDQRLARSNKTPTQTRSSSATAGKSKPGNEDDEDDVGHGEEDGYDQKQASQKRFSKSQEPGRKESNHHHRMSHGQSGLGDTNNNNQEAAGEATKRHLTGGDDDSIMMAHSASNGNKALRLDLGGTLKDQGGKIGLVNSSNGKRSSGPNNMNRSLTVVTAGSEGTTGSERTPGGPRSGQSQTGNSRAYLASDNERHKRKLAKARERRATLILGLIMAAFICSWLPFFSFYVLRALCHVCRDYISPRFEAFIFWMGYCNSAINPIIYTIFNRDFRKAFRKILFKCL